MRNVLVELMGVQRLLRETWHSSLATAVLEPASEPTRQAKIVHICDTALALESEEVGQGGPVFVNLHENEATSVAAARAVLGAGVGRLVRLRGKRRRYVVFWRRYRPHAF